MRPEVPRCCLVFSNGQVVRPSRGVVVKVEKGGSCVSGVRAVAWRQCRLMERREGGRSCKLSPVLAGLTETEVCVIGSLG